MEKKSVFATFVNWLKSTEMFARLSKQVPGKWKLVEYYFEPERTLIHIDETSFAEQKQFWEIEFEETQNYSHKTNLSIPLISTLENGTWNISRNFISLINPHDFRNTIEFQIAIEKGDLKLLKKDAFGKIEFFGFFKESS